MATNLGQFTLSASPATTDFLVGYVTAVSGGERRWTIADVIALGGDVDGPASATDNAIALFDTTTGKLLKNSALTYSGTTLSVPDAFSLTSAGSIDLTAGGANENVTITPSGTGAAAVVGLLTGTYSPASVPNADTVANSFAATGPAAGASSILRAARLSAIVTGSQAFTAAVGLDIISRNSSSVSGDVTGISSDCRMTSTGSTTNLYAYRGLVVVSGAGNLTNGYIYEARAPGTTSTGTITTQYAFYAAKQKQSLVTTGYAFYNADSADLNFFAGSTTFGNGSVTLGTAGTSAAALAFLNATSGSITIAPPAGALGTRTQTLQAVSDTFVYRASTDTLTNKTLTSPVLTTPALGVATATSLTLTSGSESTEIQVGSIAITKDNAGSVQPLTISNVGTGGGVALSLLTDIRALNIGIDNTAGSFTGVAGGSYFSYGGGAWLTFNPSGFAVTLAGNLSNGTSNSITTGTIELGHATDTTLARGAAGRLTVEGVNVVTVSSTDSLTNKTLPSFELGSAATDTTVARGAAGQMTVEGNNVFTATKTTANELEAALFAADSGSTDAYAATLAPVIAAYVTGNHYRFKANTANTGAATLALNGLSAITIKKAAGGITTDLATNDIRAGQWVDVVYDGTNFQMQSLLGNAAAGGSGLGYCLQAGTAAFSPSDAATLYFGQPSAMAPLTVGTGRKMFIPIAGTITVAELFWVVNGVTQSNENVSIYIRLNNSTDTLIETKGVATSEVRYTNTALSIAVAQGDYIEIKIVCPTWATNPTSVFIGGHIYIAP